MGESRPPYWVRLRQRYDQLGCLGGIVFFASLIVGMFVLVKAIEAVVICSALGTDAYFTAGVRYADNHGRLTNGQDVAVRMGILTPTLYLTLMPLWALAWLHLILAVSERVRRTR